MHGRKPLPLLISIYIDGCLLNSTHTRFAIPVIITLLNDKKKSSTVIGFNYEALPIPAEVLDNILISKKVIAITQRKVVAQLALKQFS
jgi:hypothetical protein